MTENTNHQIQDDIQSNKQLKNPFIPIALMQFCAVGTYTMMRQLKDALIISSMEAYLFSWIKVLAVMPASILFNYMYRKLQKNSPSQAKAITRVLYAFLGLFIFFSLIVFPFHNYIQMPWLPATVTSFCEQVHMPGAITKILQIISAVIGNWAFVLLYAAAEVWGSASVSVIAWGAANDVISAKKSSSLYPLIGSVANIGAIIASAIMFATNVTKLYKKNPDLFRLKGSMLMLGVCAAVVVMVLCYKYVMKNCKSNEEDTAQNDAKAIAKAEAKAAAKKKAQSMSFMESIKSIWQDSYLWNIATLVIAYNVAIALIDVTWKDQIATAFKDDFSKIQSGATLISGFVTIIISLLFSFIGPYMPWATKAMLTVTLMGITSVGFFALVLFGNQPSLAGIISKIFRFVDPMQFAVVIGALQNIAVKSTKYTLFDSTKEQAFAAGDDNTKYVGKAIIDVTCSRLSKSAGGLIQTVLTILIPIVPLFLIEPVIKLMQWNDWSSWTTQKQIAPILGIIVFAIVAMWFISVTKLSKMYEEKRGQSQSNEPQTALAKLCSSPVFMPVLNVAMLGGIYVAILCVYGKSIKYVDVDVHVHTEACCDHHAKADKNAKDSAPTISVNKDKSSKDEAISASKDAIKDAARHTASSKSLIQKMPDLAKCARDIANNMRKSADKARKSAENVRTEADKAHETKNVPQAQILNAQADSMHLQADSMHLQADSMHLQADAYDAVNASQEPSA